MSPILEESELDELHGIVLTIGTLILSIIMSTSSSLKVLRTVSSMRQLRSSLSGSVSLIPTMGMLHSGHISLIRLAAAQTESIIVSIYVNPTQLATAEERATYPSILGKDLTTLEDLDNELGQESQGRIKGVFAPTDNEMYPYMDFTNGSNRVGSHIIISPLAGRLEGADQPFHFIGVATICLKIFNAIKPQKAYFGEKDFQQTVIIKRLVADFLMDIEIVVGKTVREVDGLAVSSRNVFLGSRRRKVATVLWRALLEGAMAFRQGELRGQKILENSRSEAKREQMVQEKMEPDERARFEILYFRLSALDSLEDVEEMNPDKGALLSGALQMLPLEEAFPSEDTGRRNGIDTIRLVDSMVLEPTDRLQE